MIRVEVQPYCDKCRVFEADVEKPDVTYRIVRSHIPNEPVEIACQSDTVIRCTRRKQCENIKRFLEQQEKEKKEHD